MVELRSVEVEQAGAERVRLVGVVEAAGARERYW